MAATHVIIVSPKNDPLAARTPGYAAREAALGSDGTLELEIWLEDPSDEDEIDEAVREALEEEGLDASFFTWDADTAAEAEI